VHRESGVATALDQAIQRSERRHRRSWRSLGLVTEHSDQRTQLDERFLAGVFDRRQRRLGLFWAPVNQVQGDPRLDVDQRHVVSDDVVQLPGDAQPLFVYLPTFGLGPDLPRRDAAFASHPNHLADDEEHQRPGADTQRLAP